MASAKVLENRLRRKARRQGYFLAKSKRRDPDASDYGGYMLVEVDYNTAVFGATHHPYSATLGEIECFLNDGHASRFVGAHRENSGPNAAGPKNRYCVRCDRPGLMTEMRPLREVEYRIVDGAHCYFSEDENAHPQDEPEFWVHHACVRDHTAAKVPAQFEALAAGAREMARAESEKPVTDIKKVRLLMDLANAATPENG